MDVFELPSKCEDQQSFSFPLCLSPSLRAYVSPPLSHTHTASSKLLFGTMLAIVGSTVFLILSVCHAYLICEGQTTWEYLSGPKITYLKDDHDNPFDEGLAKNLKWFFLTPSPIRPREWEQVYLNFKRRQAMRKGVLREVVVDRQRKGGAA
jgi:hypothetical protein